MGKPFLLSSWISCPFTSFGNVSKDTKAITRSNLLPPIFADSKDGLWESLSHWAAWSHDLRFPYHSTFPNYSSLFSKSVRFYTEADTFYWPSSVPISLHALAGLRTSN